MIRRVAVVGIWFVGLAFVCALFWSMFTGRVLIVRTGSMEPAIAVGDAIYLDPAREPEIGEVITFERPNALITHRVVAIENGLYRTQGDSNQTPDDFLVSPEQVRGVVALRLPFFGYLIAFAREPGGLLILIGLPLLLTLYALGKNVIEQYRVWRIEEARASAAGSSDRAPSD